MMLSSRLITLSAFLHAVWAFEGSAPLLAWSSDERPELFGLKQSNVHESLLDNLLSSEDLCSFNTVVVVDHPGLHANDLKSLSSSSHLPSKLQDSKRSLSLPYTKCHSSSAVYDAADSLARRCGAQFEVLGGAEHPDMSTTAEKMGVYYLSMPSIYGEGGYRRQRVKELEHDLSRTLAHIESTSPSHLVIYTGSSLPGFDKRQVDDIHPPPFSFSSNNSSAAAAADNDGIFHRYALFSTGLIVSLIVVLFLLVPIVLLAVRSLASIQSSVRLDAPKGPSLDKKNQ